MTIKQYGGVFGRNPTFNDVTIEGQLTFDGDIDINSDLKVSGDIETTGNVIIATSGKGIDFSATAGAGTSELFDDYEEGTWTPTLVGSTSAGTATFATGPNGTYTKIGNQVTVYFDWNISAHTGTGALRVNGLPFAAGSITAIGAIMDGNYTYSAGRTKLVAYPTGSVLRIYQIGSGVGYIENVLDTSHQINGSVTYTV